MGDNTRKPNDPQQPQPKPQNPQGGQGGQFDKDRMPQKQQGDQDRNKTGQQPGGKPGQGGKPMEEVDVDENERITQRNPQPKPDPNKP